MKTEVFGTELGKSDKSNMNAFNIISGGGERTVCGNLIVSGKYAGRLLVDGTITLDTNASVTGEIIANEMILDGRFKGIARVKTKAVFHKTAAFAGNLLADEAVYHEGCTVTGRRVVTKSSEKEAGVEIIVVPQVNENYNSLGNSIIFSGNDDRVYMIL